MIGEVFDFSKWRKGFLVGETKNFSLSKVGFTVKLSSNLFVGRLGLTLRTWDGKTLGTPFDGVADDDELAIDGSNHSVSQRILLFEKKKKSNNRFPLFKHFIILIGLFTQAIA